MLANIGRFVHTYRTEILIFTGAFAVRALYAIAVQMMAGAEGFIAYSDAEFFYYRSGINLLEHHAMSIASAAPYYPDAFHTPLYSLFLAALFFLRMPLLGVALVQALLAGAMSVLVYRTGLLLSASRQVSLIAAVFVSIEPMSVYWGTLLMSDLFFAVLLVLSFYLLLREKLAASALVLGLAALARPIALMFIPAYLAYVAYVSYRNSKNIRTTALHAILILVLCAAVVAPWFVRNKLAFGVWGYTSAGWYDLYMYPVRDFASDRGLTLPEVDTSRQGAEKEFGRFDFEYAPLYKKAALSVVSQDFPGFVLFQIQRSIYSLSSSRYEYLLNSVVAVQMPQLFAHIPGQLIRAGLLLGQFFWIGMYLLAAFCVFDSRIRPWALFVLCVAGINAGISGGINPGGTDMSRYSIGIDATVFVLAVYTAAKWIGLGRRQDN